MGLLFSCVFFVFLPANAGTQHHHLYVRCVFYNNNNNHNNKQLREGEIKGARGFLRVQFVSRYSCYGLLLRLLLLLQIFLSRGERDAGTW